MFELTGKTAIVTGAAGNLGQAVGRALQAAGARTALVDFRPDALREAYRNLEGSTDHLMMSGVDLSRPDGARDMVRRALDQFGRLDALVHTVGGFRGGSPVHEDDLETWSAMLELNLMSTLHACRSVIPPMLKQRAGRIVTISARGGLAGAGNYAAYSAAKSTVLRLTESLSQELKPSGITVNCVLPSTMDTPQNRQAMPDADFSTWVPPEAIADVILFLVSDAARAVTGAAVPVYGRG